MLGVSALDTVFPRTCDVCGSSLDMNESMMCLECLSDLPRTYLHLEDFNTLHQRIGGANKIDIAAGWFYYYSESDYARLIREAKYDDRPAYARQLGRMYGSELAAAGLKGRFDLLLPVPLHRDKLLRRGYNQSREIALGLAEELGCETGDNLTAVRHHGSQTHLSGYQRYVNVTGSYDVKYADELDGLSVAIVDDVVTTGSTMLDCINALSAKAKPSSLNVLSIGVTHLQ